MAEILTVWPVAQRTPAAQREGRYLRESTAHPAKMPPDLARRIVEGFSAPGDLVVDPMCGIGTTVVEAASVGRRSVGVDLEARWASLAEGNLAHALADRQRGLADIRVGDARRLGDVLGDLSGRVELIATSPPYACEVGNPARRCHRVRPNLCNPDGLNYSADRANLGHARGDAYRREMGQVYQGCFEVLRPGGHLVTVTKNMRRHRQLLDLASTTVSLACDAGFVYAQHAVSLLAALRDDTLAARPSFWQQLQTGNARARGEPVHLVCHEDVLVFVKPEVTRGA